MIIIAIAGASFFAGVIAGIILALEAQGTAK